MYDAIEISEKFNILIYRILGRLLKVDKANIVATPSHIYK